MITNFKTTSISEEEQEEDYKIYCEEWRKSA